MIEKHNSLTLVTLDPEGHAKTCNYWFLVLSGSMSHTAFEKPEQLTRYLKERGLELTAPLPDTGTYSYQKLAGAYREQCHMSYDEFYALKGERIRQLSNADYTLGIVTTDADGVKTVHYLNPNCRDRVVYNYSESRAALG